MPGEEISLAASASAEVRIHAEAISITPLDSLQTEHGEQIGFLTFGSCLRGVQIASETRPRAELAIGSSQFLMTVRAPAKPA